MYPQGFLGEVRTTMRWGGSDIAVNGRFPQKHFLSKKYSYSVNN